jgi:hypothetical protein
MFEIMHGILPQWIFEGRKQLDQYLDADHNDCTGNSQWTISNDADNAHIFGFSNKSKMDICY